MRTDVLYFDYAASAPQDPQVAAAVLEAAQLPGNPSAVHSLGREMRARIDAARQSVADLVDATSDEVIFTSGATEANNLAVAGLYQLAVGSGSPGRVLTSPFEHSSVAAAVKRLADQHGAAVDVLPVGSDGRVRIEDVEKMIKLDTVLVTVMAVNNVLGTIQPVEQIGRLVKATRQARGSGGLPMFFHVDAVQAAGRLPISVNQFGCDALALSGHKLHGPKGVGALWLRRGLAVEPLLVGGGQEAGRRAGTENFIGIVGLGVAAELARLNREVENQRDQAWRERLQQELGTGWRWLSPNEPSAAVPNLFFLQSDQDDGETLTLRLDSAGVAVSTGSACDAGSRQPALAIKSVFGEKTARRGGIRVSWGRFTTEEDIDRLAVALKKAASK